MQSLVTAPDGASTFTVHLCPPDYPRRLFPFRCDHDPKYHMLAGAWYDWSKPKLRPITDSAICMACGAPQAGTYGGNVLGCIEACRAKFGHNAKIGLQLIYLRDRYLRIAVRLFGEEGWKGAHRRWSAVHRAPPGRERWRVRSRFFPGIAEAMADQWGEDWKVAADA